MTSVERVVEYAELESEAQWETDFQPPEDWPQTGTVTFDRVNFSYSVGEPLVLKDLSVTFASKEKVFVFISTCSCLPGRAVCDFICTQSKRGGEILLTWHYFQINY